MSNKVYLGKDHPPKPCDFCEHVEHRKVPMKAEYDAKTLNGFWANLCKRHFKTETRGKLGTGLGQQLVYADEPETSQADKRRQIMLAVEAGDFDAAEDLIGDGDISEFL
jgi:hypothetical protein